MVVERKLYREDEDIEKYALTTLRGWESTNFNYGWLDETYDTYEEAETKLNEKLANKTWKDLYTWVIIKLIKKARNVEKVVVDGKTQIKKFVLFYRYDWFTLIYLGVISGYDKKDALSKVKNEFDVSYITYALKEDDTLHSPKKVIELIENFRTKKSTWQEGKFYDNPTKWQKSKSGRIEYNKMYMDKVLKHCKYIDLKLLLQKSNGGEK